MRLKLRRWLLAASRTAGADDTGMGQLESSKPVSRSTGPVDVVGHRRAIEGKKSAVHSSREVGRITASAHGTVRGKRRAV